MSAKEAWQALKDGNQRYSQYLSEAPHMDSGRRALLRDGQSPIAAVIACSDSRVPVEHVFDAGLGDLFVIRTAGQILGDSVLGSVSYAVNSLEVPLVVVLSHEGCGAVQSTCDALERGKLPDDQQRTLIEKVTPSIVRARSQGKSSIADFEITHAEETAAQLMQRMPKLGRKVREGTTAVVAGRYLLETGLVETLITHGEV